MQKNQLISFDEGVEVTGEPFRESIEEIVALRMGLSQNIRSSRYEEMVKVAEELFLAIDSNSANQEQIRQKLVEIEAEFSDDPAYLASVRAEVKIRNRKL